MSEEISLNEVRQWTLALATKVKKTVEEMAEKYSDMMEKPDQAMSALVDKSHHAHQDMRTLAQQSIALVVNMVELWSNGGKPFTEITKAMNAPSAHDGATVVDTGTDPNFKFQTQESIRYIRYYIAKHGWINAPQELVHRLSSDDEVLRLDTQFLATMAVSTLMFISLAVKAQEQEQKAQSQPVRPELN